MVRQNVSLLASFVITTEASVYYSCQNQFSSQRQLMLGGLGACLQENFEFCHLRWHSRPFWAKLATNIDPAIAMHNYYYLYKFAMFLNNFIKRTVSFSLL